LLRNQLLQGEVSAQGAVASGVRRPCSCCVNIPAVTAELLRPARLDSGTSSTRDWSILLPMSAASLLAPLNSTMLAVALPDIRSSFGVSVGAATWLVFGYLVCVAITQPIGGRLGDAFGCRRIIVWGLVLLLGSSFAATVAPSYALLLGSRALQGVAAALVMPTAMAYLRKSTDPNRLGSALGMTGAAIAVGAAAGPVVGAGLLLVGDWRWLFFANIPLAALALALVVRVPDDAGEGRRTLDTNVPSLFALAAIFIGLATLGNARRIDDERLVFAAVALLPLAVLFYLIQYRARGGGVVDLRLFTRRPYAAAAATVALSNLVMYTALVAIPLYLADARNVGDGSIGLVLFAMSASLVVVTPLAGRRSDRSGPRVMIVAGSVVLFAAAFTLAAVLHHPPLVVLVVPLILVGIGLGLCTAAQQSAALKAWPGDMAGSAAGTLSMMRYVGSITGTALIAALVSQHPTEGEFRPLFFVVAGVGALCVLASLAVPVERPASSLAIADA